MADNDYILRKDALAFQDEIEPSFCFDNKTRNIFSATKDSDLVGYLNAIPAADVRPVKIGHYITDDMGDCSCSECGEKYLDITKRFCPECGAELRRNDGDQ